MCVAALVMGILGLFFNLLAILAIIFGGIGMSQTGKDPNLKGRGMAVAGLVLGIIGIIGWIIAIIWWSAFWWFI
jgi:Co/Zn/Cd efflux system component